MKFNPKVAICRFAYGGSESSDAVNWLVQTTAYCAKKQINLMHCVYNDTPAPMARNRAVRDCLAEDVDLIFMVDNDMYPDAVEPENKFFDDALSFFVRRYYEAPTVIGAPYCGPPPNELVYVFRWRNHESGNPNPDFELKMFTREEAEDRTGVEVVAALPTGLIAIDARIFTGFEMTNDRGETVKVALRPPFFYYEYKDEYQCDKASTEDVAFSRDVALLYGQYGVDALFVDWNTWAGHWKRKLVGKPTKVDPGELAKKLRG